jgi:hypothetical protein
VSTPPGFSPTPNDLSVRRFFSQVARFSKKSGVGYVLIGYDEKTKQVTIGASVSPESALRIMLGVSADMKLTLEQQQQKGKPSAPQ